MPITAAYITYQYVDNPNGFDPSLIAETIFDPPQAMPDPWVTIPYDQYLILIAQQQSNINQKSDDIQAQQDKEAKIDIVFNLAWAYVFTDWDVSGLLQLIAWLSNPSTPSDAIPYIQAVGTWKDAVMYEYLMIKKQAILTGQPYDMDYSFIGPTPCKFTDIFLKVRPQYTPVGYTFPDVSTYTPGTRQNPWQY